MKKIYSILFTAIALFAFMPSVRAQRTIDDVIKDPKDGSELEWPKDKGIHQTEGTDFAYSKNISSPQSDGTYWIKLESFSTGAATKIRAAAPADIILVLDLSSSMTGSRTVIDGYNADTTPNGGWTYSNVGNNHYVQYQGEYYQVSPGGGNRARYIRFRDDSGTYHYLWGSDIQDSQPAGTVGNNTSIYTGTLYTQATHTETRLQALKNATTAFIQEIEWNDKYEDEAHTVERQGGRLGNRISIITFNNKNNTQTLVTLNNGELTDGKADDLIETVEGFETATGTEPYQGFLLANAELATIDNHRMETASRTVVFFTDGEPYDYNDARTDNRSAVNRYRAVAEALKTKNDYDATVYSVGLFSSTQTPYSTTWNYLNYISSNAPNATDYQTPGDDWDEDAGYFYDASDPSMDLTKVFTDIAQQSGGSASSLSAASSNVDVVSNSFMLPEGADEDIEGTVKVFFAKLEKIEDGEYVFYDEIISEDITEEILGDDYDDYKYYKLDDKGKRVEPEQFLPVNQGVSLTYVDPNGIKIQGFDYSSNFCGPIYEENWDPTGHTDEENAPHIEGYNGFKIIVMIPIKMNPDAVGGPDVETNAPGSGIYVKDGDATALVPYESPTVSLPVNIHITKSGLSKGESAKFMIERADLPESGPVNYNALEWHYVSTVFVTKPENAADTDPDPIVYVRGLPANEDVTTTTGEGNDAVTTTVHRSFVYRITEEPWSWSYTIKTEPKYTDTDYIDNPFTFVNEPIQGIDQKVRHAESKATNVFKEGVVNVKYDDSKTNVKRTTPTE